MDDDQSSGDLWGRSSQQLLDSVRTTLRLAKDKKQLSEEVLNTAVDLMQHIEGIMNQFAAVPDNSDISRLAFGLMSNCISIGNIIGSRVNQTDKDQNFKKVAANHARSHTKASIMKSIIDEAVEIEATCFWNDNINKRDARYNFDTAKRINPAVDLRILVICCTERGVDYLALGDKAFVKRNAIKRRLDALLPLYLASPKVHH